MLLEKLKMVFEYNNAFINVLNEETLRLHIDGKRSNSIGSQITCVLQARDAYGKSILENREFSWEPEFSHSERYNPSVTKDYAVSSMDWLIDGLVPLKKFSKTQESLILDLIGHEYMHQGQLIRYFYANNIPIPAPVKSFWHLED